ncbi:MAG: NAD(+)/NADH kinase [Gammaproteobacteria bacterium]
MTTKFDTIALMGNLRDPLIAESAAAVANHLPTLGATVFVDAGAPADALPATVSAVAAASLADSAKLIIAIGGDGAMLHAAREAARAGIPVLGLNRGRLGYLADMSPSDNFEPLNRVLAGDYVSEQRMMLRAEIISDGKSRDCGLALNDVVVKRQTTGRMLEYHSYVDGRFVNSHGGDGFIVATPTGSTAYALSVGGPIVAPDLDVIVLAPICPHTLSDRPIVIPGECITEVQVGDDRAEVNCDGEVSGIIEAGDTLRVAAAERRVNLIHPAGYDYFEILRSKLHWGRSNRRKSSPD